ncbi:VOC family protein [Psychrobium sp. MM17-31]|uniref:VOC family protein n=1 Tax=Psychrobium sp. MM17-31 TaxID=2917758 RepID=UPI001EF403FA|nr:VOC family protein [Psychrobium sp. MM17-31]MCG7532296.1 VOC family protein [Psychrobium sp. MM17-31]
MIKLLTIILTAYFSVITSVNADDKPLTSGFNHVGLTVSNLDKSTRFFTDVLKWKLVGGDEKYPAKFVSDGKMFLTLWQTKDPKKTVTFNRKNNVGLHHLAFTVETLEGLNALFEKVKTVDGVIIEFAPEPAYGGPTMHMMIREPSGNRLEFSYRPPKQ